MIDPTSTELITVIDTAIDKWMQDNSPEKISKEVKSKLDKYKDEITLKLLGFDKSYGEKAWKLDHCNGRAGNSAAGDYLRATQAVAIEEWLSTLTLPVLTPSQEESLLRDSQNNYYTAMRKAVLSKLTKKVEEDSTALINSMLPTLDVESFLKAKNLIQS